MSEASGDTLSGTEPRRVLDREALDRVWSENRRWVAAVLLAHKPSGADLEDLLQDVAHSLVEHADTVRSPEAVGPWLRTVAINTARAEGRKHTRRARLVPVVDADPATASTQGRASGGSSMDRASDRDAVRMCVDKLPVAYREPLLLRAVRGMSNKQAGEILGLTESAVESRVARARRMLRGWVRAEELAGDSAQNFGSGA